MFHADNPEKTELGKMAKVMKICEMYLKAINLLKKASYSGRENPEKTNSYE